MPRILPGTLARSAIGVRDLAVARSAQPPPVLVVGMHNSGTSMISEILHESGVFMGNNMDHYESHFFSIFVNDLLIMGGGDSWSRLPLLAVEDVVAVYDQVGDFVRSGGWTDYLQWGYDGHSRWGIKDPRLCVLLPLYLRIYPDATVLHIRRNPDDVAASLTKRNKRGVGVSDDFHHWKALTLEYTARVEQFAPAAAKHVTVEYERLCVNPTVVVQDLFEQLDLEFSAATENALRGVHTRSIGSFERYSSSGLRSGRSLWRRVRSLPGQSPNRSQ